MPKRIRPRHLTNRGPRWYWQPTGALRAGGWELTRLLPENGDIWLQAEAINQRVDRWRAGLADPAGEAKPRPGTIAAMVAAYQRDADYLDLAAKTRAGYKSNLKLLCELGMAASPFGSKPVASITPPVVQTIKRLLLGRGRHMANGILSTARLCWAWGIRNGHATANPWLDYRKFTVRPRDQIWTAPHRTAFKAAATTLGYPSLSAALDLALYTVQRPADVIAMSRNHWREGMIRVRQQKTGRVVHVPPPAPLKRLLETLPKAQMLLLVDEAGNGYTVDRWSRRVREVLDHLHASDPSGGWSALQLRDTRRTGVVALAEAGCTVPEIRSISGHDTDECQRIIDTYCPPTVPLAKAAVRRWNRKLKSESA